MCVVCAEGKDVLVGKVSGGQETRPNQGPCGGGGWPNNKSRFGDYDFFGSPEKGASFAHRWSRFPLDSACFWWLQAVSALGPGGW